MSVFSWAVRLSAAREDFFMRFMPFDCFDLRSVSLISARSVLSRFGADRRRAVCRRAAVRVVRLVLIFPKSRAGKNTRKMPLLRNRGAERRVYENRAYEAGKDHRYLV